MSDTQDHFTRLGLSAAVVLDRTTLDDHYFERAAAWHPDRFVDASPEDKAKAQRNAALINEAYRTLKDARARAQYLVKLGGIDLDSSDPDTGAPAAEPAFLMQMLELRESLDDGDIDEEDALDEALELVDARLQDALNALQAGQIQAAARFLVQHRYLMRWTHELQARMA